MAIEAKGHHADKVLIHHGILVDITEMRRMQDDGLVDTYLVESASGPPRKYYRLTEAGRASFTNQKAEGSAFCWLPAELTRLIRYPLWS